MIKLLTPVVARTDKAIVRGRVWFRENGWPINDRPESYSVMPNGKREACDLVHEVKPEQLRVLGEPVGEIVNIAFVEFAPLEIVERD